MTCASKKTVAWESTFIELVNTKKSYDYQCYLQAS